MLHGKPASGGLAEEGASERVMVGGLASAGAMGKLLCSDPCSRSPTVSAYTLQPTLLLSGVRADA